MLFPLSALSVGYRANVVNVYDANATIKVTRWRGKENRTMMVRALKRERSVSDSLRVNDDAMDGEGYVRICEESRTRCRE